MDAIYKKYATLFSITYHEAENLITQTFNTPNNQEKLLSLVGYDNIEDVSFIISNLDTKKKPKLTVSKNYVEISIQPPPRLTTAEKVSTKCVDSKYQSMFDYKEFNDVQSEVFNTAYNSNKNFLVSAPTGCGKTDVAMLVILHALEREGKVFLIAPMKALSTEIYDKLKHRLARFSINVLEYTGDTVTSYEQLQAAKIVVATPEKFDIMTRKLQFDILVSTLIIDEIHILHDRRGAVIETIVCRMLRHTELFQRHIRIVGLSATLPNYKDVAKFILAQETFYFEPGYRPVPLEISLVGVKKAGEDACESTSMDDNIVHKMEMMHLSGCKEINIKSLFDQNTYIKETVYQEKLDSLVKKKALCERFKTIKDTYNEVLEEKIEPMLSEGQQVLVFVTSRKETEKTANYLKCKFTTKVFDIHHAGLSRQIRHKTEKAFKARKIDVIVTTSTLAWGVNLPAKCVIIKGTQFYDHETSKFENLGILDVLQIFGRAGRPQFDTTGRALLITDNKCLNEYYELLNNNTLVESKLLFSFMDIINCEIYLKNISMLQDAVVWLKSTFLFVRMLKAPLLYGFSPVEVQNIEIDSVLSEYVLIALKRLNDTGMISIEGTGTDYVTNPLYYVSGPATTEMAARFSCRLKSTFLGRIASFYFINFESVYAWTQKINLLYDEESVLDCLLASKEFDQIMLREDEIDNLRMLSEDIDVEFEETALSKMKILYYLHKRQLQTYSFSLSCDLSYVVDNLERIINAFEEIIIDYNLFNLFDATEEIKNSVSNNNKRKTHRKIIYNERIKVKVTRIGEFIYIDSSHSKNVLVDKNNNVIYVTSDRISFVRVVDGIVKIRNADMQFVELTHNEILYRFGMHVCKDTHWSIFRHKNTCDHYNFEHDEDDCIYTNDIGLLNDKKYKIFNFYIKDKQISVKFNTQYKLIFVVVDGYVKPENQKHITYNILDLPRPANYLIITINRYEANKTYNDIKMHNVINDFSDETHIKLGNKPFKGYLIQDYKSVLLNIKNIQDDCVVVFKGLTNNDIYPIFDILKIVGKRECIIYETKNICEYYNYLISSA